MPKETPEPKTLTMGKISNAQTKRGKAVEAYVALLRNRWEETWSSFRRCATWTRVH